MKIISKGLEARNKLIQGADYLADCVQPTAGPFGQNWFLEKGDKVTNDGVTIAREIEHEDEIVNRGIQAMRKAAVTTCDEVGDGTTTATALGRAILKEAVKKLPTEKTLVGKMTPADLIRKIENERQEVSEKLYSMAKPIETKEDLINSARVSVEDDKLGEMIGSMQWELGKDGVIIAEETNERECSIKKVIGVRIDNGLGTSLVMNNQEKQMLDIEDYKTILTNHTITEADFGTLFDGILTQLVNQGQKKIVIMARAFTNEAIQLCMENIKNGFMVIPINAPYTDQTEIIKDLQAILGGRFINVEETSLADIMLSDVGYAKKVQARRMDAIFTGIDSPEAQERITKRIEELTQQLKGAESDFERNHINERLSQLKNGFAMLYVGANSEIERKRLKDKADDAVIAVRMAFQGGVVDGAGLAFKQISEGLPDDYLLKYPLLVVNQQIMSSAPEGFVIEDWVKDPAKVLDVALKNACSVAGTLATAVGATATQKSQPIDQLIRRATKE